MTRTISFARRLAVATMFLLHAFLAGPGWAEERLRFIRLSTSEGLPHTTVFSAIQDQRGFLWFGTQNGIARYDGYGFEVYRHDPEDSNSLSDNDAGGVVEDASGALWVRTWGGGINRFDPANGRFTRYRYDPADPRSLSSDRVQVIYVDRADTVWAGTFDGGLNRFDPGSGKFQRFRHDPNDPNSLSHDRVWSILQSRDGTVWVGTDAGLNRFDPKSQTFERVQAGPDGPQSLGAIRIRVLYEDRAGRIWIGSDLGLFRFEPASGRVERFAHDPANAASLSEDTVNALIEDRRGRLWVGTSSTGLNRLDEATGTFTHYAHDAQDPESLGHDDIRAFLEDDSGVMWVGTRGGGLSRFDNNPPKFGLLQSDPEQPGSLSSDNVYAMAEDPTGALWVGTWYGGLNRMDPATGRFTSFTFDPQEPASLGSTDVNAIHVDEAGALWVGTWNGGLNLLNAGTDRFTRFRHDKNDPRTLSDDNVLAIAGASAGDLWIGTREGGLNLLQPNAMTFEHWRVDPADPNSLSNDTVNALLVDHQGQLWIGTDGGLNRMNRERSGFVRFRHDPVDAGSLSHDRVMCVHEAATHVLWIGTRGGGLNALEPARGTFRRYTERDGLPSNTVSGILEDDEGRLWISTDAGLCRFDPKTGQFRSYDAADGLQGDVFHPGSYFKSRDGEMYFGGPGGLNRFRPYEVRDNPHVPKVVLTAFRKFDKTVRFDRALDQIASIALRHRENFFSFEFAALDFMRPSKNRYAYKLEGFDADWVDCGTRRYASYTNLDGGDYTFRVRGSNNDGIWNETGASIRLRIAPPPWKTWWAYLLYVAAFLGSIAAYGWMRTRSQARRLAAQTEELERQSLFVERLQRLDQLKDEFLANTSHELRTPLNGIIGLAESLADGAAGTLPEAARSNLMMITTSGRRLARLVNEILDFSKLKTHDLPLEKRPMDIRPVVEVVFALCRPLVGERQVELRNEVGADVPPVEADENRLEQIFHNLVGNAVKFTDTGWVSISAKALDGMVEVTVQDTGIGMPADRLGDIFRPFEQVDGSDTRRHGGTGLGLSITHKLVELHGGNIRAESSLGVGSRFMFTLPVSTRKAETASARATGTSPEVRAATSAPGVIAPASGLPRGPGLSVLVVDDDPVNVQVLANALSLEGHIVTPAFNGKEALDAVAEREFHLILLDVMMPGMSGYEVCRVLRETHSMFQMPVLMLTAKTAREDILAGFRAGANDYVAKPFDRVELVARVKTLLEMRSAVSRALVSARQFASEKEQRVLAQTFHDLFRTMTSTLDLGEVLERLLQSLNQIVAYDTAAVTLRGEDGAGLRVMAARGYEDREDARRRHEELLRDETILRAFHDRTPYRFLDRPGQGRPKGYRDLTSIQAALIVPLISEARVVGLATLERNSPQPFVEPEVAVVFALVEEAGVALQNARLYGEVQRLATTDGLTGLFNRQHFFTVANRELDRARRYGSPLSLIMQDVDHFKKFNDTYGHTTGDEVLRFVANLCANSVRASDAVGRYGGEEFILLLPETDLPTARVMAERLRARIAEERVATAEHGPLSVTISLGVATLSEETPDLASMIERADQALYRAKRAGRNRVEG